jgi:hypothetical protein
MLPTKTREALALIDSRRAERSGSHVVLHDLDAVVILEGDPGHLVEGHRIPRPTRPTLRGAHVVEQVGHRRLATGTRMLFGLISL